MRQNRTTADEPYLTIRSLAVDYVAGGREQSHRHRWPQLLYAIAGAVTARVGGRLWIVPPRHGLWIPAGTTHSLAMTQNLGLRTLYFRPGSSDLLDDVAMLRVDSLLHEAVIRSCEWGSLDERLPSEQALDALIRQELLQAQRTTYALQLPSDPRARQLADMMLVTGSIRQDSGLPALCREAGLSRRTAERLFIAETGLSPARWWRRARLIRSLAEIAGGASTEAASITAGYRSRSAFHDAFVATFGFAPGAAKHRMA